MDGTEFFESASKQSVVKSKIVSKYFYAWAKIMATNLRPPVKHIFYIDLFAGRGKYDDGTLSTPLRVLKSGIRDDDIRRKLVAVFNDKNSRDVKRLRESAGQLDGYDSLTYEPQFQNFTVNREIADKIKRASIEPVLMFIDPFGYKGISLELIDAVLEKRASEVIFFFNYQRFNPAISNPLIVEPIADLLGGERAKRLRSRLDAGSHSPKKRRSLVMNAVEEALTSRRGQHVLPFRFFTTAKRLTHHLIFVSKHDHGRNIMKDIMAREGDWNADGIPAYEYRPGRSGQKSLFNDPIQSLAGSLEEEFAGRTKTVEDIYFEHGLEQSYIMPNYKAVLKKMETEGLVEIDPPASSRPDDTLAESCKVTFPQK
jgi:three-Cys-motif partner protein